jgi:hypothetical protein
VKKSSLTLRKRVVIVAQEAEGKSGNAWSSLYSCEKVKMASLR